MSLAKKDYLPVVLLIRTMFVSRMHDSVYAYLSQIPSSTVIGSLALIFLAMISHCPVDLINNHPFGPPPNRTDFQAANDMSVRAWIEEAFMALEISNSDTLDEFRAFMLCSGEDRLATFL